MPGAAGGAAEGQESPVLMPTNDSAQLVTGSGARAVPRAANDVTSCLVRVFSYSLGSGRPARGGSHARVAP